MAGLEPKIKAFIGGRAPRNGDKLVRNFALWFFAWWLVFASSGKKDKARSRGASGIHDPMTRSKLAEIQWPQKTKPTLARTESYKKRPPKRVFPETNQINCSC